MSLTPSILFNGRTNCINCDKPMDVNDQGITYNVHIKRTARETQDLMFCVPCALKVTHSVVGDLISLSDREETFSSLYSKSSIELSGARLRSFGKAYEDLATKINEWADIHDEVKGVMEDAVQEPRRSQT